MLDELDARKSKILWAVVDDYIASAEPVGSSTLARKYNLGISPATIRNELADLEMLGFLEHPHTSAGRIPSSKGYRFYVNGLLPVAPVTDTERRRIHGWYRARVRRLDEMFRETARLIADVTHNVALVLAPQAAQAAFRLLQFLPMGTDQVIAVLMTDAGFVENRVVDMPEGASFADFQRMAEAVNRVLSGKVLSEVTREDLRRIRDEIGDEAIFAEAMHVMHRALEGRTEERLYLGGTAQLLANPEYRDLDRVREMLLALEREDLVKDILHTHAGEGLTVTIGRENTSSAFWDTSVVTASYHVDGKLLGTIAVLGPTRMEYAKAMRILDYVNANLTEMIHRLKW
ncbi:heat-inducible transcriptional repressor HrcA [Selenomonas sp. F0473]|uniref:heat-inducible transcriptional repressor HrcA n=1 Tax=Selenomonas sp. F0473 TaxID=999423 RepID=UPI00029E2A4B|nr:heat-inducible transcriptional repressor HrcA [Selenomonas sp. F0473]EKU70731.1 heat-inducible transcription repressor HrcA [Selenomonas sp. F0473]